MDEPEPNLSIIPTTEQSSVISGEDFRLAKNIVEPEPTENIVEPDWVVSYRTHRRRGWLRWLAAAFQLLTSFFVAWIFYIIPVDPSVGPFYNWKNPVIIFILICFIGKTLVDTLFYDHYRP